MKVYPLRTPIDGRLHPVGPFEFDVTRPEPPAPGQPTITLRTIDGTTITRLRDDVRKEPATEPRYRRYIRIQQGDQVAVIRVPPREAIL